jgi:hypothetical protein
MQRFDHWHFVMKFPSRHSQSATMKRQCTLVSKNEPELSCLSEAFKVHIPKEQITRPERAPTASLA